MGITGRQIKDDSVEGKDIKDGSVELIDFAPDVMNKLSQIDTNYKNILINSTEIRALKQQDLDQDLSIFVDSFDDQSNIDSSSINFNVNSADGYTELIQGGQLFVTESSENDFNQGSFTNSEAFLDIGGNGAIRKSTSVQGAVIDFPNFPVGLTITLDGQSAPISTKVGTYIEGVESSQADVNFKTPETTQSIYEISFNGNITPYKFIQLYYLKREESILRYRLQLEDSTTATFEFPQREFVNSQSFQEIKEDLSTATGIDLSSITFFRILLENEVSDQTILSLSPQNGNNHMEVREDRTVKQNFFLEEDTIAQILKVRVRWENNEPDALLDVAISNVFETTLATGRIFPQDASGSWQDFYVTLDTPVVLKKDVGYSILIQSPGSSGTNAWDVARTANNAFPLYPNFYNGNDTSYNTVVDIVRPPISEPIYFDKFSASQESVYLSGNEFISRGINLGLTPTSIDNLTWIEDQGNDEINIRLRFASTESGLLTAPWTSFYNNPDGNSVVATPNQWVQFQLIWANGTTDQTTNIKEIAIFYTVSGGQGNAIIVSQAEFTSINPTKFMILWEVIDGNGTSDFFVSRDGKVTWQAVPSSQEGQFIDFTSGDGNQVHARAILTGDAKLFSWALGTNEEFI